MVRVKILPPHGCDRGALDEKSWADLPEGSTVRDVLRLIRCSPLKAKLLLVSVNGERSPLDRELREGDVVGFFFPVSGG
ncbi:MAG: MoaD/ThiS family protein [Oscillospiraceae bacterium]|nr:MoaD/ThiS family protein [Oscillospiraceae bacterium]